MNRPKNMKPGKGGRPLKKDPSVHRYVFRLTDQENARFLSLFEKSGLTNKSQFIVDVLFQREIRTVKIDMAAMDYHIRLTSFYSQFRAVGVNYNQVVKILYRNFSEKKAGAYLFKLEKQTAQMAELCQKIIQLTQKFETDHLKKEV